MSTVPPPKAKLMPLHIGAAVAYLLGAAAFIWACAQLHKCLAAIICFILVVSPAIYYPVLYLKDHHDNPQEAAFTKLFAELWSPLWVAISGFWLVLLVKMVE